jgi:hypothetical protein
MSANENVTIVKIDKDESGESLAVCTSGCEEQTSGQLEGRLTQHERLPR